MLRFKTLFGVLASMAVLGCASDPGGAGSSEPLNDETTPLTCGAAPFARLRLRAILSTPAGLEPLAPLAGAIATTSACPELALETRADGTAEALFAEGTPFMLRWSHPTAIRTLQAERVVRGTVDATAPLLPVWLGSSVPDGESLLLVRLAGVPREPGGYSRQCADVSGVEIGVRVGDMTLGDFPRAHVRYYGHGERAVPVPIDGVTASTDLGLAMITGLPEETFLEVVGWKAGCFATGRTEGFTGRTMLERGAVSVVTLQLVAGDVVGQR